MTFSPVVLWLIWDWESRKPRLPRSHRQTLRINFVHGIRISSTFCDDLFPTRLFPRMTLYRSYTRSSWPWLRSTIHANGGEALTDEVLQEALLNRVESAKRRATTCHFYSPEVTAISSISVSHPLQAVPQLLTQPQSPSSSPWSRRFVSCTMQPELRLPGAPS
jgi:hypothetical protein